MTRTKRELAEDLFRLVTDQHAACGGPVEGFPEHEDLDQWELHPTGAGGVVAFKGDLYMVALAPNQRAGEGRTVLRILRRKLAEVGTLRSTVFWRNWTSAMATKKLGARLVGMDADGYFHYELTRENFRHGQEKHPQAAGPQAAD